jgi:hypothetical protein
MEIHFFVEGLKPIYLAHSIKSVLSDTKFSIKAIKGFLIVLFSKALVKNSSLGPLNFFSPQRSIFNFLPYPTRSEFEHQIRVEFRPEIQGIFNPRSDGKS